MVASGEGLGLGLSIVARLADLLGTKVELRSTVGRGSMFAFELPLGIASATALEPPAPSSMGALRGTFALVIDDDEAARAGMCGLLETWGCVTLTGDEQQRRHCAAACARPSAGTDCLRLLADKRNRLGCDRARARRNRRAGAGRTGYGGDLTLGVARRARRLAYRCYTSRYRRSSYALFWHSCCRSLTAKFESLHKLMVLESFGKVSPIDGSTSCSFPTASTA